MQLDESCIYITGILLKRLISFVHILFNYICQNRIFSSRKLICPSSYNGTAVGTCYGMSLKLNVIEDEKHYFNKLSIYVMISVNEDKNSYE